ncbi:protein SCAR1-like isoform X2 [Primulina eburnea]|uniref:protein SCAR1-like isoform X2 n=1 Tax=Primulina eburnea TaxID=1245227 RepID=UPI003C6C9B2E
MPLARAEVRNCYGLGVQELYREANKEDPKEIFDGVTVAGLVGILRQLGDLAEFAAEVFHGLQEEVMVMSSRTHNLRARTKQIESALSPLEKVVLAQRSHLHFAYTTGSNWQAHIQCDQNHFVFSDMPQFIMASYEDCRSPPRLQLLDRFDPGGPGSCLKRYSDPNLFKRESVASGEASDKKVTKDKKRLRIKKKKLWARNGELAQGASFSHHDGRMQVTQLNGGNKTTQIMSDLDDQSSLDLRNGSTYSEGDFHPSHSVQTEEPGSRDSISSPVKRHYVDDEFLDYIFLQEKISDAYDYIQINLSQDQAGCSSPSITWDEKIEAREHDCDGTQNDYHDRNQESFPRKYEVETRGDTSLNFETVGKMDGQPLSETLPTLEPSEVHLDDIESETGCLIDATNTVEFDHQTDCRKRQEIEHFSKLWGKAVDNELEIGKHNSECHSSYSESDGLVNGSMYNDSIGHNPSSTSPKSTSAQYNYDNPMAVKDVYDSMSSVDKALLPAQRAAELSDISSLPGVDSFETVKIDGITNEESVASTSLCSFRYDNSGVPMINRTGSPAHQKPAIKTSYVTPVMFWTNGGLLGLEPSKPPDLNANSGIPQYPASAQDEEINTSSQRYRDIDSKKPNQIEMFKNFETGLDTQSYTFQEHGESGRHFRKPSWKISHADLGIKRGITGYSLSPNNASSTEARTMATGSSLPVNSMFKDAKRGEENSRSSVRISDLGDRLQTTGSNIIPLHGREDDSHPSSYRNSGSFERNQNQSVAYKKISGHAKDFFGCESSILSPSSSPPLGHLKISFKPIDGVETSKLKLKFPDGNINHETSRDFFPSFQLVPEITIIRQNIDSDSDDTFCRSSSSLSDDCLHHQSESNSGQWESGQLHCGKDLDLYDDLYRISLTQSAATDQGNGRSRGEIHYGLQFPCLEYGEQNSGSSFDFRSSESQSEFTKEPRNYADSKHVVRPQGTPTPTTPPPVQWRGMESHLDDEEGKRETFIKGSYFDFDLNFSASTTCQQPKPTPFTQYQDIESAKMQESKQSELQTSNRQREANQLKGTDEKQDFLQQIRSKSLNLRPTVIGKSKYGDPTSNVHVSAILRKVNAIRQVVGSDDGEGESNWSDA